MRVDIVFLVLVLVVVVLLVTGVKQSQFRGLRLSLEFDNIYQKKLKNKYFQSMSTPSWPDTVQYLTEKLSVENLPHQVKSLKSLEEKVLMLCQAQLEIFCEGWESAG